MLGIVRLRWGHWGVLFVERHFVHSDEGAVITMWLCNFDGMGLFSGEGKEREGKGKGERDFKLYLKNTKIPFPFCIKRNLHSLSISSS